MRLHRNLTYAVIDSIRDVFNEGAIDDKKEKKNVLQHLKKSGKEVVSITENQMHSFAGNMLELQGKSGSVLVMSKQANESLTNEQLIKLEKHAAILVVDLKTRV